MTTEDIRTRDELHDLAAALHDEQSRFHCSLVEAREGAGLTPADVGQRIGWSEDAVTAFERYDADPTLASVRQYALAIGVRLRLSVAA